LKGRRTTEGQLARATLRSFFVCGGVRVFITDLELGRRARLYFHGPLNSEG